MADGYVQQAALKVFIKVVAFLLHFGRNCSSLAYKLMEIVRAVKLQRSVHFSPQFHEYKNSYCYIAP